MIPNLIAYSKLLVMRNKYEKAQELFLRALEIHKKSGNNQIVENEINQNLKIIEKRIEQKNKNKNKSGADLGDNLDGRTLNKLEIEELREGGKSRNNDGGLKVIIVSDPGRDLDDEFAFLLLSSLDEDEAIDLGLIGVVTVLSPSIERVSEHLKMFGY